MAARPSPSAAPFTIPANSASPELKATVFWVVGQCLTACWPRVRTPRHVDRRVSKHPAKIRVNVRAVSYTHLTLPTICSV
eukprot:5425650-Alexandrium_andersonii.AAC.1